MRADFIPDILKKAFDIAVDALGAVHIELPEDVAEEETSKIPLERKVNIHTSAPDHSELKKVADLIKKASAPIILAGNGVINQL